MQSSLNNTFFALLRAGLWEQSVRLSSFEPIDFDALFKLAEEQSVVGLIAAGLEHAEDVKVTKPAVLPFLKRIIAIENRNLEMNSLISRLFEMFAEDHIEAVLVKGQGLAQCYERPLWRSSGDIDLLLDSENYEKAKSALFPIAESVNTEKKTVKHQGLTLACKEIELHGTLHSGQSLRLDSVIDGVQSEMFKQRLFREWDNKGRIVFLPSPDCDIVFVFSHILQHLYKGGIGLRQICDWCRLQWSYRESIDRALLAMRLNRMGIMRDWKVFTAFAIEYLGFPQEASLFYTKPMKGATKRIQSFILEVGNFGHNRNNTYQRKNLPIPLRKTLTLCRQIKDNIRLFRVSPLNSIRFTFGFMRSQMEE